METKKRTLLVMRPANVRKLCELKLILQPQGIIRALESAVRPTDLNRKPVAAGHADTVGPQPTRFGEGGN